MVEEYADKLGRAGAELPARGPFLRRANVGQLIDDMLSLSPRAPEVSSAGRISAADLSQISEDLQRHAEPDPMTGK